MAFRRDSKVDAFQRQISALRNQLGGDPDAYALEPYDRGQAPRVEPSYHADFPDLDSIGRDRRASLADAAESPTSLELAPVLPPVPSIDTQTSVIAHSTAWNGHVESTGSLHVHGRIEGTLTAREDIFVTEEGEVDAVVSAANVTIAGSVRGSIHCLNRFEVLPRGRVAGDIQAPIVVIHEGALVVGDIAMTATKDARSTTGSPSVVRAANGGD